MQPRFASSPLFLLALLVLALSQPSLAVRNKEIDENYQRLIPLSLIPQGCEHARGVEPGPGGDPAREYGFVEGVGLEKCRVWLDEESHSASDEDGHEHYERYKCKHLRIHGNYNEETGKCLCKERWKGPICNDYIGCPVNHSYYLGVCTPNVCQHEGQLALGTRNVECICKAPWDGRNCDRLACWRMAEKEHERRWRNAGDRCRCADNFVGENCETIISCQNGELIGGRCQCAEGWKGEVCDRKCTPNQTCGAAPLLLNHLGLVLPLFIFSTIWLGQRWTAN